MLHQKTIFVSSPLMARALFFFFGCPLPLSTTQVYLTASSGDFVLMTLSQLTHRPLVGPLEYSPIHVRSSLHCALYLELLVLQMPCWLPSHTAIVSFPFSHLTVGLGEPLTVHWNLAFCPSFTTRGESSWFIVIGVGADNQHDRINQPINQHSNHFQVT